MDIVHEEAQANVSDDGSYFGNNASDFDYIDPFEVKTTPGYYAVGVILAIIIILSSLLNIFGFSFLVRCRMWLKHEGYVYLVAIFAANTGVLIFDSMSFNIRYFNSTHYPPSTSEFMCRLWHFFMNIFFTLGWLSTALLLNVYLREHLVHRRRCGCPMFAAKYCTLFASKVTVAVIFGAVVILALPHLWNFAIKEPKYGSKYCLPKSTEQHRIVLLVDLCLFYILPFVFFLPIILILTLCITREGGRFGFSQIGDRSLTDEQFRTLAVTSSANTFFSQFLVSLSFAITDGVKGLSLVTWLVQIIYALSLGFQPVFCVLTLSKIRDEILQKLKNVGCCRSTILNHFSTNEPQMRLTDNVREDVEDQSEQPIVNIEQQPPSIQAK